MMRLSLPGKLAAYFAAQNQHDIDTIVACFTPDARVRDEGADIVGPEAIRAWKEETGAKYKVSVEPLECRAENARNGTARSVVVARVSGTFPGSPATLSYRFGLAADGRIATLEIA